jgi:hypothetical protein
LTEKQKRKLAFYEVCSGQFFKIAQGDFEKAQRAAVELNGTATVTLKLFIEPPDDDERFGHISFSSDVRLPAKKSAVYTTEIQDGFIVNDGTDMDSILQTTLEFPELAAPRKERAAQ